LSDAFNSKMPLSKIAALIRGIVIISKSQCST